MNTKTTSKKLSPELASRALPDPGGSPRVGRRARTSRAARVGSACAALLLLVGGPTVAGDKGGGKGGGGGGGVPGNPEIAYVTTNSLYVMDADGANSKRLLRTSGQGSVWAPCWSPDGSQIVFLARVDGQNALCVIGADGSGLQPIHTLLDQTPLPSLYIRPDWSPAATLDGTERIVFADVNPATGAHDIFVIDPDGSNLRPLTDAASSGGSYGWACWTSDATGIVRTNGSTRLELMRLGLDGAGELAVVGETLLYEGVLFFAVPKAAHVHDWIVVSDLCGNSYSNAVVLDITDPDDVVVLSVIDSGLSHLGVRFSADDSELVYYRAAGSTSGVFRVNVFGGAENLLLDKGYEPDWRGF